MTSEEEITAQVRIWEEASQRYLDPHPANPNLFYTDFGKDGYFWKTLISREWFESAVINNHPLKYRIEVVE